MKKIFILLLLFSSAAHAQLTSIIYHGDTCFVKNPLTRDSVRLNHWTKADLQISSVENTPISTWVGSANITSLGTIVTGTWHGTPIGDQYISSATAWNNKQTAIATGTTGQYLRGDLSMATFPTTTSGFSNSTDKNFVTDAQATVIGNTSGTNTGDQTTVSGNAGTATILQTTRSIYGNNFNGSTALAQIIASTYGGTGNGFTKFSGPASTEKTFTLPNASAAILTDNAVVTSAQGGTGVANNAASTLTISGNFGTTFTISNTTSLTLPTSGTLLTTVGSAANLTSFPTLNQNTSGSAATLTNPRAIQGVNFDGSAAINILNGTGFVKASGTSISYDNTTYLATNGSAANLTSFPTLNQNTSGSAATLTTPRAIQGVNFDGSAAINPINGTGFIKASGTSLSYDNSTYQGISAGALPATTGTMTATFAATQTVYTITPTGACTFNGSGGTAGARATFVVTTSGTSAFTLTWSTNFKTTATLSTGTTSGKIFAVNFVCTNGTQWIETGRTTAQ